MAKIKTINAGHTNPDGLQLGATGDKIGFGGTAPITQPSGAAQTALTDNTGGAHADATLAAVGVTNTGDRSAAINDNFAKTAILLNKLRADIAALGLIKGGA